MPAAQLSDDQQEMGALLKEPDRVKKYALEIVERYVSDPQNQLDGTLHPGLDASSPLVRLDTDRHKFVKVVPENEEGFLKSNSSEVKAEEQQFIQAMKEYEAKAKDKYKTGINIDEVHTMEQVWEIVDQALQKYQNEDVKSLWGRIRGAFRKLGEHNKAVEGWLGLLPTESHYLSVLCGGLKLILKAAARMKDIRDEIFDALEVIPTILNGTKRVLMTHKESEKLQGYSSALYVSILKALGHILVYLRQKSVSKVLTALFKQSSFELALSKKIDDIGRCRDAFNSEAAICLTEMLKKVQDVSKSANKATQSVLQEVLSIEQFLGIAFQEQLRVQLEIKSGLKDLKRRQSDFRQKLDVNTEILNQIMEMLLASPKITEEAYANRQRLDAPEPNNNLQLVVSNTKKVVKRALSSRDLRRILLSRLNYGKDATRTDVVTNYTLARTLSREDQERCLYVIRSSALASWVKIPISAALLVNGNSVKPQRRSPLSFVCAKLVYTLDQIRSASTGTNKNHVVAVHFFCGEHVGPEESRNTPCGVANSILAQLLKRCKRTDLTDVIKLGDFDSDDLRAVCERFECALAQLPEAVMVFCIIDGLSFYIDDEKTTREAEKLVKWLVQLTRRQRKGQRGKEGGIFKLLITAPIRLHGLELESLDDNEMVDLPRRLPSGGGFTEMKWELGAGRQLEDLA